ncbi:PPC domain-containing protein [Planktothrix sp. FACHB-1355]|uniref:PPC domain-containing protein n=2 Tax=Cyanophyceae TaxID=3028117 RepID=A0A926VLV2_9CYAN|nr:PPC domain-containing protein [Aerosakkonema funiforme FACHB-1375]MBD3560293.1 PPC domain-containing protein [Planktothrix sp. FACHB-1355]
MMIKAFAARFSQALLVPATLLAVCLSTLTVRAQTQSRLYNPISLPANNEITDSLSDKDIPTGQGGFARDYAVTLNTGDNVAIDLTSENFDTIVTLLAKNGTTVAENDDGPDGSTNSLLFTRIKDNGTYIIRVRAFGETAGGEFKLKVTRLREI